MLKNKTLDTCGLFEKQTNFDRITKSTEALAEFMAKHEIFPCGYIVDCDNCSFSGKCSDDNFLPSNYEKWLEWLKQESE